LIEYLVLALMLSAIFLAMRYVWDLRLAGDTEPGTSIPGTGPVVSNPPPDSYEQRFRMLEQWLGQTQDVYESRFEQLEQRFAQSTSQGKGDTNAPARTYDIKLRQLELWLGQTQDAYEARFEELEQRLVQISAPDNARLQRIEQQLARLVDTPVTHLKDIEEKLAQTTSRLDELSASMAPPTGETNTIIAANEALRVAPPAAEHQPVASAPQTRLQPKAPRPTATMAGTAAAAVPTLPPPRTGDTHSQGKWAINLASYVSEKAAGRKMDSFREKGVSTEMVSARVNGRTIYRVRIAGFESQAAARAMAATVEQQLGLEDTWIMAN
jgi:cell division septation protein DedD